MTTATAETIEVHNPATGELLGRVPAASPEQVAEALEAAQAGRRAMAALPAHERAALLGRIADGIEAREEELARLLATETASRSSRRVASWRAAIRIFARLRRRGQAALRPAAARSTRCPGWSATWR